MSSFYAERNFWFLGERVAAMLLSYITKIKAFKFQKAVRIASG
jgi:hypothetical protein